jgi:cation transport regulator
MPYRDNDDLPDSVRRHLPPHAQDIYREAFNHAFAAPMAIPDRKKRHIASPGPQSSVLTRKSARRGFPNSGQGFPTDWAKRKELIYRKSSSDVRAILTLLGKAIC